MNKNQLSDQNTESSDAENVKDTEIENVRIN
jgi:hypothetical protein